MALFYIHMKDYIFRVIVPEEKVVEEKKVSQLESVQKTDSMAKRKLIYPPKTPAKKKSSLQAANAKSMNIYRSVSRKPKRK